MRSTVRVVRRDKVGEKYGESGTQGQNGGSLGSNGKGIGKLSGPV